MNWFYSDNGQQRGPISEMEFTQLARQGSLGPNTLVWREGLPDWQPLSKVRPDLVQLPATSPSFAGMPVAQQDKGVLIQQMREGVISEASMPGARRYVGFWWRVLARIIDTIVLTIVSCVILLPLGIMFGAAGAGMSSGADAVTTMIFQQIVQSVIQMTIYGVYFTWMTAKYGATLGKLALGFHIVTSDGLRPTGLRSFGRWAADQLLNFMVYTLVLLIPVGIVFALGYTQFMEFFTSGGGNEEAMGGLMLGLVAAGFVGSLVGAFPWWMAAFDSEKRTLHDRVCSTRVVWK